MSSTSSRSQCCVVVRGQPQGCFAKEKDAHVLRALVGGKVECGKSAGSSGLSGGKRCQTRHGKACRRRRGRASR